MQFLRDNRQLFFAIFFFPLLFLYVDRMVVTLMKDFHAHYLLLYSFLRTLDGFVDFIAHGATLIIASLVLYVSGRFFNSSLRELGKRLFTGLVLSGVVVQALKHLIGRARPRLTDISLFIGPSMRSGYDSFPSGHTALAFCMACILSRYFPRYRVLYYLFAIVVGLERIEDLAHFPSDVLAGAVVGLLLGKIMFPRTSGPGEKGLPAKEEIDG